MRFTLLSIDSSISKLAHSGGLCEQKLCLHLTVDCFEDDHIKVDNILIICSEDYYNKNNLEQDYDSRVTCSITLAPESLNNHIEPSLSTDYAILLDGHLSVYIFLKHELFYQFSHQMGSHQGLNDLFISFCSYPHLNNFNYQASSDDRVGAWTTVNHQHGNQLRITNFEFNCRLYTDEEKLNNIAQ